MSYLHLYIHSGVYAITTTGLGPSSCGTGTISSQPSIATVDAKVILGEVDVLP